jgi:hypothetical protein
MNKRILGFVRWYDEKGDDGILQDFEGNEYYFNSWSFPKTKYRVTGTCKITGKQKTVMTRYYPGLFLSYTIVKDNMCMKIDHDTPVEFEQAKGIDQRWAVSITLKPELIEDVLSHHIECSLDYQESLQFDPMRVMRLAYVDKSLDRLIGKVWGDQ